MIEHENGGYSAWASKLNVRNDLLLACSARSYFKPVKAPLFLCATGIIAIVNSKLSTWLRLVLYLPFDALFAIIYPVEHSKWCFKLV